MIRTAFLTILAVIVFAGATARAHSVWIESDEHNQLVIRFAEPGEALETSPGHLDDLGAPTAFTLATNAPTKLDVEKKKDGFVLHGAATNNVTCAETAFNVRGGRKPIFYARWQPAGTTNSAPLLTLDVVPTGKPGEARIYFRGQPLGGEHATLRGPDEKEQDLTADAEGLIHFTTALPGEYLLTVPHHRETLPGFHNGLPYKETSHNCSLFWLQPKP